MVIYFVLERLNIHHCSLPDRTRGVDQIILSNLSLNFFSLIYFAHSFFSSYRSNWFFMATAFYSNTYVFQDKSRFSWSPDLSMKLDWDLILLLSLIYFFRDAQTWFVFVLRIRSSLEIESSVCSGPKCGLLYLLKRCSNSDLLLASSSFLCY